MISEKEIIVITEPTKDFAGLNIYLSDTNMEIIEVVEINGKKKVVNSIFLVEDEIRKLQSIFTYWIDTKDVIKKYNAHLGGEKK